MNEIKINHLVEYLSPILILSYFFIHNIFLVFIGMTFSLYLINTNYINKLVRYINKKLINKEISSESNKINNAKKSESKQIQSTTLDSKLTLVETIEELGFISSIDKQDESKAA